MRRMLVLTLAWMCVPAQVWAQDPAVIVGPYHVRIGVVDLVAEYAKNDKYKALKLELPRDVAPYKKKREELNNYITQWGAALRKAATRPGILSEEQKAQGMRVMIEAHRQLEDLDCECRNKVLAPFDSRMEVVHTEVAQAMQDYAAAHGFDLVVGIGELVDPDNLRILRTRFMLRNWLMVLQNAVDQWPDVQWPEFFSESCPVPVQQQNLFDFSHFR